MRRWGAGDERGGRAGEREGFPFCPSGGGGRRKNRTGREVEITCN